jgi:hypothetical protein
LLRVTALVQKCARLWITKGKTTRGTLANIEAADITAAEKAWIKAVQGEAYRHEIDILQGKPAKGSRPGQSKTLIRQLRLYLDENELIRLNGRLHNGPIDIDTKFPYLLPNKHPLTDLLIRNTHAETFHYGMKATVACLRQRYWIPQIRAAVNSQIRHCVTCRKMTGKPYQMPEAPPLQEAPPFTVTGCDFTGALYVIPKGGGPETKVYIALFTCAVTRAIHLEIVPDMTTQAFLNAFRRFSARRSLPQR